MGDEGTGQDGHSALPAGERLVNLTPHEIVLRVNESPTPQASPGQGSPVQGTPSQDADDQGADSQSSPGRGTPGERRRSESGRGERTAPIVVRLARSGQFARVNEARLGVEWLNLDTGSFLALLPGATPMYRFGY